MREKVITIYLNCKYFKIFFCLFVWGYYYIYFTYSNIQK